MQSLELIVLPAACFSRSQHSTETGHKCQGSNSPKHTDTHRLHGDCLFFCNVVVGGTKRNSGWRQILSALLVVFGSVFEEDDLNLQTFDNFVKDSHAALAGSLAVYQQHVLRYSWYLHYKENTETFASQKNIYGNSNRNARERCRCSGRRAPFTPHRFACCLKSCAISCIEVDIYSSAAGTSWFPRQHPMIMEA